MVEVHVNGGNRTRRTEGTEEWGQRVKTHSMSWEGKRKCVPITERSRVLPYVYILNKWHYTGSSYRCRGREDMRIKSWGMEAELAVERRHLSSSPETGSRKKDKSAHKGSGGWGRAQEVSKVPVRWLLFSQVGRKESWGQVMVDPPQQEEYFGGNCMHA